MTSRQRQRGLSLLELMVTIMVVSILAVLVIAIFDHVVNRSRTLEQRLMQQRVLEHSIDRLAADLAAADDEDVITVASTYYDEQDLSQLIISNDNNTDKTWKVEWVSVARFDQGDLVLFRRQNVQDEDDYIPVCDNLHSFIIELYDAEGKTFNDPNRSMQMVEIVAEAYLDEEMDPERILTVRRTFCRNRF